MKHLLFTTIAAVVLVGCGPQPPDISIHDAVEKGNIEVVKQHLAAGTDVNAKNKDGTTPLHKAALKGHKEVAELLIAKGADVNAMDESDVTPLHQAASYGHKEIAELLIAEGADVNAKIKKKYYFKKNQTTLYINTPTPLDWANINKQTEIADLLRKHGGKKGEVFKAEDK